MLLLVGPRKLFRRVPHFASQRGGSQASCEGETGATRRPTVPARTGSSSSESAERPMCNCADAVYVVLSTEFKKSYHGQRGVCPLEDSFVTVRLR